MNRDQARALIESAVKLSKADEIQVNVSAGDEKNVRFADNRITTSGLATDVSMRVFSAFGRKQASATSNDTSAEGIEQLVRRSEALARLAPENPEALPLLGAQTYQPVNGFFDTTAKATAEMRAPRRRYCDRCREEGRRRDRGRHPRHHQRLQRRRQQQGAVRLP